jgi:hypothetical protein
MSFVKDTNNHRMLRLTESNCRTHAAIYWYLGARAHLALEKRIGKGREGKEDIR